MSLEEEISLELVHLDIINSLDSGGLIGSDPKPFQCLF